MDGFEVLLSMELHDPLANVTDGWICTRRNFIKDVRIALVYINKVKSML